jgi:hypothetical protein
LSSFKGTIDQDNYKIKYKLVAKTIKNNIIRPGLNDVIPRVSKLITDNFPTIPSGIVNQFSISINNIIKATDDFLNVEYIKKYLEENSYVKSKTGEKKETPKPSFKTTEIKYKEGEG